VKYVKIFMNNPESIFSSTQTTEKIISYQTPWFEPLRMMIGEVVWFESSKETKLTQKVRVHERAKGPLAD
jgi:hypothetical protein